MKLSLFKIAILHEDLIYSVRDFFDAILTRTRSLRSNYGPLRILDAYVCTT